jgi:hypothetical protein
MGARQIILMCSLARPRRLMASMPLYDIIVIHCGIVPTSLIAASCQLYCCMSSSCDFHVVLYLYSGIDATSTLLWGYAAMKAVWDHTRSFLRHHCQLWLRHHAGFTCGITAGSIRRLIGRLAWSLYCSSMSSCDFHVVLYLYSGIDATSTLLLDYAAMKAV